ncbi:MAG: POTRA domain-containing protein, partial [Ferruginibacter sp.]
MKEEVVKTASNAIFITFYINKGKKVKVNSVNFASNSTQSDEVLKKQMKGTKEMTKVTIYPKEVVSPFEDQDSAKTKRFNEYLNETGYLSPTKTKSALEPYLRLKLFSSSKFNETKYQEDKERLLNYYNTRGYRDAVIIKDTLFYDSIGNLNIDIKVNEGRKYYFGNMVWKGNTKYPDSILNLILAIKKGDTYNLETLSKRLGKQLTAEGGDIGSLYMDDGYLFFRVEPIETAVYNDTIDFEIRMAEGPQATYGNITVSGNDKTKDYVVLRELRTIPGEKFS